MKPLFENSVLYGYLYTILNRAKQGNRTKKIIKVFLSFLLLKALPRLALSYSTQPPNIAQTAPVQPPASSSSTSSFHILNPLHSTELSV